MTSDVVFWNRIAESYARQSVKNPTAYEHTLNATRAHLSYGDTVLELGCGTGTTALALAESVAHIRATDVSDKMIGIAERKRTAAVGQNITFRTASVEDALGQSDRYDAILAFNLLHLLENYGGALAGVFSRLRPGGVFISKSTCLTDMNFFVRVAIRGMQMAGKAPFVSYFSVKGLEDSMRLAGFEIEQSRTFANAQHQRFIVARRPDQVV